MFSNTTATAHRHPATQGFTLIEIMITVAILGLLLAVALPSFQDSIRKGRRAEAFTAISQVQHGQERWRANRSSYAESVSNTAADTPPGLALPATTAPGGHYGLALSSVTGNGYIIIATAGGGQASDAACKLLGARMSGGNVTLGSGSTSIDFNAANPDPNRCWAR